MTTAQVDYIVTRPGGPAGESADTWETLAARASQLADTHVTARALIDANVSAGATADQTNAWISGHGGFLSADGVNYILPANLAVSLPAGVVALPDPTATAAGSDAGVIDGGPDALGGTPTGSATTDVKLILAGAAVLIAGAALLYAAGREPSRRRTAPRRRIVVRARRGRRGTR